MQQLIAISAFIWLVMAGPPTDEEREEIVEFHTRIRENVNPPASKMQLMMYSIGLENLAKQFAQMRCAGTQPDPSIHTQFQGCGIFTSFDNQEDQTIVGNLNDTYELEKGIYSYDKNACTWSGNCFHFKTMVWWQTTEVGCTIEACQGGGIWCTVCVYKPGEFEPQDRPYEKGQSCTKCPSGFACYRNQCENSSTTVATTSSATITSTLSATSSATIASPLQILPSLTLILRCFV
uniref:SCP domain-containing protein n=2 Tax=Mesocestoides corti TaxID=53468 RepID=A0A5K3FKW8_MESCO